MSKKIRITGEILEDIRKEFEQTVLSSRMLDGKITYTRSFTGVNEKTTLRFTPDAFTKMTGLVHAFSKEVAWHCCVERNDEANEYLVYDILVYPQTVSAANVEMDTATYAEWLMNGAMTDERFFHLYGQGHSHVNMSTGPSGTDMDHQKKVLADIPEDGFYVFMIWNKRNEHTLWIYDLRKNIVYDNADITLKIGDADITGFLDEAKTLVKDRLVVQPVLSGGYSSPVKTPAQQYTQYTKQLEPQKEPATPVQKKKEKASMYACSPYTLYGVYDDDEDNDPSDPFYVRDHYFGGK